MFNKEVRHTVKVGMNSRSMSRLTKLMTETEAESEAQVIKNSLRLYEVCIEWARTGNRFALISPLGDVVPVDVFAPNAPDTAVNKDG